jgi:mono/diheme cytochrome c family protein
MLMGMWAFEAQVLGQLTPKRDGSPTTSRPTSPSQNRTKADHTRSIQLYQKHCMTCHDPDGRGEESREIMHAIPDFTNSKWQISLSDAQLARSIREGKKDMPAMKGKPGPTDVLLLVSLVRDFRDGSLVVPEEPEDREEASHKAETGKPAAHAGANPAGPPAVAFGASKPGSVEANASRVRYQRLCESCHDEDGRGRAFRAKAPTVPDFASVAWQQRRSDVQLTVSILEGKGKAMPGYRDKLSDSQVRSLVAYLRGFAPAAARTRSNEVSGTEFDQRYEQLQNELKKLNKQSRALSRP